MLAIVGGTGLSSIAEFELTKTLEAATDYGTTSSPPMLGELYGKPVVFLPRHGSEHTIAPHLINYRANIQALKSIGVEQIIAINAVGGITEGSGPADVVIPDQIIDYTYGREHTFSDGLNAPLQHIDFTYPYTPELRQSLIWSADKAGINIKSTGTYAATQGPRLETPAEIERLKRDGCDIVGMTGMPEASLAREANIDYASLALSVNWAAGIVDEVIIMEDIQKALDEGMSKILSILEVFIQSNIEN